MNTVVKLATAAVVAAGLSVGVPAGPAHALTFNLDQTFSDESVDPTLTPPWVVMTFGEVATGLSLSIEGMLPEYQRIKEVYFNLRDADLSQVSFTNLGDTTDPEAESVNIKGIVGPSNAGGFKADGDGYFDIMFDFGNTFAGNAISNWLIESTELLLETANILALSITDPNKTGLYVAAKINSIGDDSAWITGNPSVVPLPAGLVLFLSGLAGLGFLGRYKAKRRELATT